MPLFSLSISTNNSYISTKECRFVVSTPTLFFKSSNFALSVRYSVPSISRVLSCTPKINHAKSFPNKFASLLSAETYFPILSGTFLGSLNFLPLIQHIHFLLMRLTLVTFDVIRLESLFHSFDI